MYGGIGKGPFTQEDPAGLAGGLNLYGFGGGDPVTYSDPFGLFECDKKTGEGCSDEYKRLLGADKPLERQGETLEKVALVAGLVDGASEGLAIANLGSKLEFLLGRATGSASNVARSQEMLTSLKSIGLGDTQATRAYLAEHLGGVLNDASNIVRTQANGRIVRESLLMGPKGAVKLQTIWEDAKLITANVFRSK